MDLHKVDLMTEAASLRSGWQACQARLATVEAERDAARAEAEARVKQNETQIRIHFQNTREWKEALKKAQAAEARAVEALRKIKDMAGEEAGKDSTYGLLMQFAYLALETAECALDDSQPAIDWLAQQRREAAAEALEEFAYDADGIEELITCNILDLRSALRARAAALQAGEVADE